MQQTLGLVRGAQLYPERIATICDGRARSFSDMRDRVARMAAGFAALGLGKHDRIAILSDNSDYQIEAFFAVPWFGAVTVPVNFRWSTVEIAHSLNEAACTALLLDEAHAALAPALRGACPSLRHMLCLGALSAETGLIPVEQLIADNAPLADTCAGGDDLAGIYYTGGTTGHPKGVMLSHGNIGLSALSMLAEGYFEPDGRTLVVVPLFHLGGTILFTAALLRGSTLLILPQFRPEAILEDIERHRITDMMLAPTMIQALLDHPRFAKFDLSSIRHIRYGAAPASEKLIERVIAMLPGVELTQGYGLTESAAFVSVLPWRDHLNAPGRSSRLRSAGRGTFDVSVRIIDSDWCEIEHGTVGEIAVRGPNVMQGYLNRPEATAEVLRDGWLRTGDMAYMDDEGYLFIVDRAKDMIISGGENVYSSEVENAIATHPAVQSCTVFGVPSERMGESVHVVLVLRAGHDLDLDELQAHCRALIAGYKLPRSLEIVPELPLSSAGKVLKAELRARHWQGRGRAIA
ncbi:long-chain fatty acid--CoA ligase [soil metagenome]